MLVVEFFLQMITHFCVTHGILTVAHLPCLSFCLKNDRKYISHLKTNGIKTLLLQLKQDKYINHHRANISSKISLLLLHSV